MAVLPCSGTRLSENIPAISFMAALLKTGVNGINDGRCDIRPAISLVIDSSLDLHDLDRNGGGIRMADTGTLVEQASLNREIRCSREPAHYIPEPGFVLVRFTKAVQLKVWPDLHEQELYKAPVTGHY